MLANKQIGTDKAVAASTPKVYLTSVTSVASKPLKDEWFI